MPLYLASSSPRRAALVKLLGGKRIEIRSTPVEEVFDYTESPEAIVQSLAYQKAEAALKSFSGHEPPGVSMGAVAIDVHRELILIMPLDITCATKLRRALINN